MKRDEEENENKNDERKRKIMSNENIVISIISSYRFALCTAFHTTSTSCRRDDHQRKQKSRKMCGATTQSIQERATSNSLGRETERIKSDEWKASERRTETSYKMQTENERKAKTDRMWNSKEKRENTGGVKRQSDGK